MTFCKELQASENSEIQQDHIFAAQNDALDRLELEQEIMAEATETDTEQQEQEVEEAISNLEENNCNRRTSSLLSSDRNSFGYVCLYLIEECKEGEIQAKEAIPRVALYHNRGKALRHLNRYEYDALIQQVKEKAKNEVVARSLCFEFSTNFVLAARYTQQLKAKQATMIFKGKLPPHPGQKPDSDLLLRNWKKRADKYANYILTMFCP
jgi:hypothetical protein